MTRPLRIAGYAYVLPENKVKFGEATRHRVSHHSEHLGMLVDAGTKAIRNAGLEPSEIDCIIGATAADIQPIPCTAALVMEQLAPDAQAAALDVNSTCTSFITALDVASRYLNDGDYTNILILSGDVGSQFLNANQPESYELFSDAAVGFVVTLPAKNSTSAVIAHLQQTWPKYAHDTEIRGGGSALPPRNFAAEIEHDYLFDMKGRAALLSMLRVLPAFFGRFYQKAAIKPQNIDLVVPHQASRALPLAMKKLGFTQGQFADYVNDFGNMVSASVPFALAKSLESGRAGTGDLVMLCGTAAGLTANALALRL